MRKLHLASFGFKVGDNKFEELRLVASFAANMESFTDDAVTFWKKEAEGTGREILSCVPIRTLSQETEPMGQGTEEQEGVKGFKYNLDEGGNNSQRHPFEKLRDDLETTKKKTSEGPGVMPAFNSPYTGLEYEVQPDVEDKFRTHSIFFALKSDPDNAVIAGYGVDFKDAFRGFAEKFCFNAEFYIDDDFQFQKVEK